MEHSLHARSVRVVRRLRRPPARHGAARRRSPGWSGCSTRSASQAPAVRTAISRMVSEGWLEPVRLPSGRGYRATVRTIRWLDDVAARVYRSDERAWDGHWHLALVEQPADRPDRQPAARRPGLRRVRRADAPHVGEPVRAGRARRGAGAGRDHRPAGAGRPDRAQPDRRVGPARAGGGVLALRGGGRGPGRRRGRPATPTRPPSRPGSSSCTSGASSSSPTPPCPTTCCPTTGRGATPSSCSRREARRLKPASDRFVASCLD